MPLLCSSCLEKFLLLFEQAEDALRVCERERETWSLVYVAWLSFSQEVSARFGEGKGWDIGLGEVGPVFPGRDVEGGTGPRGEDRHVAKPRFPTYKL